MSLVLTVGLKPFVVVSLSLMVIEAQTSIKVDIILNTVSDSVSKTNLRSEQQLKYLKDPISLIHHLEMDFLINKSATEHAYFLLATTVYYCLLLSHISLSIILPQDVCWFSMQLNWYFVITTLRRDYWFSVTIDCF